MDCDDWMLIDRFRHFAQLSKAQNVEKTLGFPLFEFVRDR